MNKSRIKAEYTGKGYPNCIAGMGGWQFTLQTPFGKKAFSDLISAKCFQNRIDSMLIKEN